MTPEQQQNQQFRDINRPGHSGPTPTSRPLIVGHRPTMPDPMINQRPMHHQPPPENHPTQPPAVAPSVDGLSPPPASRPVPLTHRAPQPSKPSAGPSLMEGEPLQSPPFDDVVGEMPPMRPHHKAHEEDPLFHGHQKAGDHASMSHSAVAKQRSKWWAPLAVLLVVVIMLYLAIDSGLINTSIEMPFHIFEQEAPPVYTPTS